MRVRDALRIPTFLVGLCALASGCSKETEQRPIARRAVPSASVGVTAPEVGIEAGDAALDANPVPERTADELVVLDGPKLLGLVRSKGGLGTLVNIWASWCGPCRRELPMLKNLADNVTSRGLSIVLVSVDEPEAEAELVRMLKSEGFAPPFYVAARPLGPFKQALHPNWPGMIPVTFLYDASARRRYYWGGPVYEHELMPIVDGFLQGEPIDGEARYELAPGLNTSP